MVDAELIEDQLEERDEVLRQLIAADAIVINNTDFVHSEYVVHLRALLGKLNPLAKVFHEEARGIFPFAQLEKVSYSIPKTFFSIVSNGKKATTGIIQKSAIFHNLHNDVTVRTCNDILQRDREEKRKEEEKEERKQHLQTKFNETILKDLKILFDEVKSLFSTPYIHIVLESHGKSNIFYLHDRENIPAFAFFGVDAISREGQEAFYRARYLFFAMSTVGRLISMDFQ